MSNDYNIILKNIFRYGESYDIECPSDQGRMYSFYKKARDLIDEPTTVSLNESTVTVESSSTDLLQERMKSISPNRIEIDRQMTQETVECSSSELRSDNIAPVTVNLADSNAASAINLSDLPSINEDETVAPIPSTSKDTPYMTTKFDYSPFKNYLKISDQLILTKKVSAKRNNQKPSAISGKLYFETEKKKQEEKQKNWKNRKGGKENV